MFCAVFVPFSVDDHEPFPSSPPCSIPPLLHTHVGNSLVVFEHALLFATTIKTHEEQDLCKIDEAEVELDTFSHMDYYGINLAAYCLLHNIGSIE